MKKERIFTGMSIAYQDLTPAQAHEEYAAVKAQFDALQAKHLKLNMARGKPGKEQLDLVSDILSILKTPEDCISDGVDAATTASWQASRKRRNSGRTCSAAGRRSASSAATPL